MKSNQEMVDEYNNIGLLPNFSIGFFSCVIAILRKQPSDETVSWTTTYTKSPALYHSQNVEIKHGQWTGAATMSDIADLTAKAYDIVRMIPHGHVTTYGW